MAWDTRGDRLAIAFGKGHPKSGLVALYSTVCKPVISARLVGYIEGDFGGHPLAGMNFHRRYSQGALLASLSQTRRILTIPMLYTPEISDY